LNPDLYKRALLLSYFTVGYNLLEGMISVFAGLLSGSIALFGFGLDSFVESLSGTIMIWRFRKQDNLSSEEELRVERRATRLVGSTFFIFAAYVVFESSRKLLARDVPDPSLIGIAIALLSIIVMPFLYHYKYQVGRALNLRSLIADSKQTLACLFLSFALLLGLGLNYFFGFWQADPAAGLIIALFLIREGFETLYGK
jgi:divalent metal cation (Fe/Co/Zn/Cd) transporter